MAGKKDSKSSKKSSPVMDVSKPGKTTPDASSRPIIVAHKPMVKDATVKTDSSPEDVKTDEDGGEKINVTRSAPKIIKPLTLSGNKDKEQKESVKPVPDGNKPADADVQKTSEEISQSTKETTESNKEVENDSTTAAEVDKADDGAENESEQIQVDVKPSGSEEANDTAEEDSTNEDSKPGTSDDQTSDPSSEATSSGGTASTAKATEDASAKGESDSAAEESDKTEEEATVGAVAQQATINKDQTKQSEADIKQQDHINQLIEEKKYFLPIRATRRRRRVRWLVVTVLVLLLAAGTYAVLYGDFDTSDIKLPSFARGTDDNEVTPVPEAESEEADDTTTPAQAAKDAQRQSDLDALATQLESYYAVNDHYPSFSQINDLEFRGSNLRGLDAEAFQDPDGTNSALTPTAASGSYAYATSPADCDNDDADCMSFTLTATLSNDLIYTRQSSR